ncbi:MAG: glycoside hydrolase family 97 C-terminal domain-containing protein [Bacteroidales bacterium]|nr:glycoside hydrolase family 97 C-terminal domain-containing protein [Bacteroidales bacterium]
MKQPSFLQTALLLLLAMPLLAWGQTANNASHNLKENYEAHMDAFQFIKDVPVDWQQSVYLEAEPGDYVTIARKDKHSEDWYVGSSVDENGHTSVLKLDFLTPGEKYEATIYADGKDASWEHNPQSYQITQKKVTSKSTLTIRSASGGGFAIRLRKL